MAEPRMTPFQVHQVELAYHATLDPPRFDFPTQWVAFYNAAYSCFRRFDLKLGDIKVENPTSNPSDFAVAFWLFSYGTVVRYRLDRLEIWSNRTKLAEETSLALAVVEEAVRVIRGVTPDLRISTHTVTAAVHGVSKNKAAASTVASYVTKVPSGTTPLIPSGVSFLGELATGGQGSLVLERSGLVPGGSFLRIMCEYPGSIAEGETVKRTVQFFQESMDRLGLDMSWTA